MSDESLEGLRVLREQLQQLGAISGQRQLQGACRAAMVPTLEAARRMAPVNTGQLRDSLRLASVRPKTGSVVASAGLTFSPRVDTEIPATLDEDASEVGDLTVTSTVRSHARFVWHFSEFGTSRQPAHPFLRPAFAATREQAIAVFVEILKRKIQRALRRELRDRLAVAAGGGAF